MEKYMYTTEDKVVTKFVIDIIETAIDRFQITYERVVEVLTELRYWELFNDTEVSVVGAHEGIEPVIKEMETLL